MKILQINTVYNTGSVGRIAADIKHLVEENGDECFVAYGRGCHEEKNTFCVSNKMDLYCHVLLTRLTDKTAFFSKKSTENLIRKIKEIQPDVIHLHNLHGYYLNIEKLFHFLKDYNKPVIWTLHDCWSFTGHCAFFDYALCERWKTGCYACIQKSSYPASRVWDNSQWNYKKKKQCFSGISNMTIVTPSHWLAELVKQSFLSAYRVEIIPNGIDLDVFRPIKSDFRKKYYLEGKKILLGVANVWEKRKGLDDFVKLVGILNSNYRIVLVGVSEKQKSDLPDEIITITHTNNIKELAEIYSCADVFLNLTYEDNFPTVNLEALACGTPVITYCTGGSPESISEKCGIVVEKGNLKEIKKAVLEAEKLDRNECRKQAEQYAKERQLMKYLELYQN